MSIGRMSQRSNHPVSESARIKPAKRQKRHKSSEWILLDWNRASAVSMHVNDTPEGVVQRLWS